MRQNIKYSLARLFWYCIGVTKYMLNFVQLCLSLKWFYFECRHVDPIFDKIREYEHNV